MRQSPSSIPSTTITLSKVISFLAFLVEIHAKSSENSALSSTNLAKTSGPIHQWLKNSKFLRPPLLADSFAPDLGFAPDLTSMNAFKKGEARPADSPQQQTGQGINRNDVLLHLAVQQNNIAALQAYLTTSDFNLDAEIAGATPLMAAAENGNVNAILLLAAAGADVNKTVEGGITALYVAAQKNSTEAVAALIAAEAKLDAADKNGVNPLHVAINRGFVEIAEMLVKAGADVNFQDKNGFTAYDFALIGKNQELVELLKNAGAMRGREIAVNQANQEGKANADAKQPQNGTTDSKSFTIEATLLAAGFAVGIGATLNQTPKTKEEIKNEVIERLNAALLPINESLPNEERLEWQAADEEANNRRKNQSWQQEKAQKILLEAADKTPLSKAVIRAFLYPYFEISLDSSRITATLRQDSTMPIIEQDGDGFKIAKGFEKTLQEIASNLKAVPTQEKERKLLLSEIAAKHASLMLRLSKASTKCETLESQSTMPYQKLLSAIGPEEPIDKQLADIQFDAMMTIVEIMEFGRITKNILESTPNNNSEHENKRLLSLLTYTNSALSDFIKKNSTAPTEEYLTQTHEPVATNQRPTTPNPQMRPLLTAHHSQSRAQR